MADDFTGGSFDELRRETEKLKQDAARYRSVTREATAATTEDEAARRRLAARARTATSEAIADSELIVQRAAATGRVSGQASVSTIEKERTAIRGLATEARSAEAAISAYRRVGPYAASVARTGPTGVTEQLAAQARIRGVGQAAGAGLPNTVTRDLSALNRQVGYLRTPVRLTPTPAQWSEYNSGVSRAATSHAVLNAQMTRHGALSSEFIQQLARGNVSLREFGSQLVVTAGKFGGWLAAGAGIFALLGTLGAVGKGAIDASSGVNQLERVVNNVDPTTLQAGFRDLSESFNLPIDQVADAAYQMGKVFHDQADALEATKSVLYAVKVGELDVATASRYLTAITNGFNLKAEDTAVVFDQVNQAQNRYNISMSSLLAGTAKAAGAFRLAGGDATHLIALITTLSKATGQTGDVIGTAIQRSPHFIAMDQNKDTLRSFGVDTTQPIQDIYADAIKEAQRIGPDKQRQLAEALFGPQYGARVGVALLQQGPLLNKVLKDVAPDNATGSAQTELERTLGSMRERLTAVGIQLGNLGSNLASSGLLDTLGLAVVFLTQMLNVTNELLDVFNNTLPAGLRHTLFLVGEIYLLFRLMRRFNIGSTLPGAAGRALTNPRNNINDEREGLIVRGTEVSNELVSSSAALTRAQLDAQVEREKMLRSEKRTAQIIQQSGRASEQGVAAANAQANAAARYGAAQQRVKEAEIRQSVISEERERIATREAALRRTPTTPRVQTGTGSPADVLRYISAVDESAPGAIRQSIANTRAQYTRSFQQWGATGGFFQASAATVRAAATRTFNGVRNLPTLMNAAATRVKDEWAKSAKNVNGAGLAFNGLAVGGLYLIQALVQHAEEQRQLQATLRTIQSASSANEIDSAASTIPSLNKSYTEFILGGGLIPGKDAGTSAFANFGDQMNELADASAKAQGDFLTTLRALSGQGPGVITPTDVNEGTITKAAGTIRNDLEDGAISVGEALKRRRFLIEQVRKASGLDDPHGLIQQIKATITEEQASASADQVRARGDLAASSLPSYRPVGEARAALDTARDVLQALRKGGGSRDDIRQAQIEVNKAETTFQEATDDRAKSLLDAGNALEASEINPERTVAVARQALGAAREELDQVRNQNRGRAAVQQALAAVNQAEFALQSAIRERMSAMVDIIARERVTNAPLYAPFASEESALYAAQRKLAITRTHGGTPQQIRDAAETVNEAERALQLAQNDRAQELLSISGQIQQAQINPENAVGVARQALTNAQALYGLAVSQGRDRKEQLSAYLAVVQAESALDQAIQARADAIAAARYDIAAARAERSGNEVRGAAIATRQALYDLTHADTRQEHLSAQAALIRARTSKRDAIYQTEIDDIQYGADIGRLTAQQQIQQYERLLKTLDLNRDMRRDLRRRIYQLRHDAEEASGEFDLRLGNIKLPTAYEIRRAAQGGINQRGTVVTINQTNHLEAHGGDSDEVVRKVNRQQDRASRRARNMLRSAGID